MKIIARIKEIVKIYRLEIIFIAFTVLITFCSFRLGQISGFRVAQKPVRILEAADGFQAIPPLGQKPPAGNRNETLGSTRSLPSGPVFASKKSKNKYYHYESCPSYKQLSDQNKLRFETAAAAQAQGYQLAPNCNP